MAKTAKLKKKQPAPNSRAARRASPSLPTTRASEPTTRTSPPLSSKPVPRTSLSSTSGIIKSSKKHAKPLKRSQRIRQAAAMERAADNIDKLELKRAKSAGKEKKVRERSKGWEEVNGERVVKKTTNGVNGFAALGGEEEGGEWESRKWGSDEDMDADRDGDGDGVVKEGKVKEADVAAAAAAAAEVEDEML